MSPITPAELAYANWAFAWFCRQDTPLGPLGSGLQWPTVDLRIEKSTAAGVELAGKRVLEVGACEGHVTIGLCLAGANVTALDARLANVLKTIARTAAWGFVPRVACRRVEDLAGVVELLGPFDVLVHFGVLYHLADPVAHLATLAGVAPLVLLDTHTARPDRELLELPDRPGFSGHGFTEGDSLLCGMQPESFWLTKESLAKAVAAAGFTQRVLAEDEQAIHGPRSLHLLERSST